jgi:hypothetical protein
MESAPEAAALPDLFASSFIQYKLQQRVEDEYPAYHHGEDQPIPEATQDLSERSQTVDGSGPFR